MKQVIGLLAACAVCMCAGGWAYAQAGDRQQAAQLHHAIENYLRVQTAGLPGKVTYTIGEIDPRMALAACAVPEVFLPPGARLWGRTSLGVRCSGTAPWSLYVTVQVRITGDYVITARPLPQGQELTTADVALQNGDLTQFPAGVLTDTQWAIGKTLTSALAAGQPLRRDLLRSPLVVQQGQTVKLYSSGPGFRITADGRSLNNAADGQIAQVRTPNGQTVSGVARAGGIVEINF